MKNSLLVLAMPFLVATLLPASDSSTTAIRQPATFDFSSCSPRDLERANNSTLCSDDTEQATKIWQLLHDKLPVYGTKRTTTGLLHIINDYLPTSPTPNPIKVGSFTIKDCGYADLLSCQNAFKYVIDIQNHTSTTELTLAICDRNHDSCSEKPNATLWCKLNKKTGKIVQRTTTTISLSWDGSTYESIKKEYLHEEVGPLARIFSGCPSSTKLHNNQMQGCIINDEQRMGATINPHKKCMLIDDPTYVFLGIYYPYGNQRTCYALKATLAHYLASLPDSSSPPAPKRDDCACLIS